MAIQNENRENVTAGVISKMLAIEGRSMSASQLKTLRDTLEETLSKYDLSADQSKIDILDVQQENAQVLKDFVSAKRVEGRSNATLYGYAREITKLFITLNKSYRYITTQDIRDYLAWRKQSSNLRPSSVENIRMYCLSFFKWCFIEELITKNPMDKIGVVKQEHRIIQTLTDEEQEMIVCACDSERDRAIVDMLSGTGMRVSELCALNRQDVDFGTGEVIVFGKGSKERYCFLTGKAKVHLKWYLDARTDDNPALFVTANRPYSRITKNGIEYILRHIAKKTGIETLRLYPHKYRSTLATNMINKGAPVEMVQGLLGHSSSAVTLKHYARIDKDRFKQAHHSYA
jgi:site-specific recombinase XerD